MEFRKEFDFVIYPIKLVITVGITEKELEELYANAEPGYEDEWGGQDGNASFVNLVKDKNDKASDGGMKYKILWNFEKEDDITIQNICHESLHIATSLLHHLNMSLGFKIGEDEHAAYIAGFAGKCVTDVICEMKKKK